METNPKEYDTRSARMPQPNQFYEGRDFSPQGGWQRQPRPQPSALPQGRVGQSQPRPQQTLFPQSGVGQQPKKAPAKMPKARVLAMANKLKKGLVIASIMGFGMFGGLATLHQVGTTVTANKTSSTSSQTSSSQNSANFLKQSGTATATPTNTATATTVPVTGSSTS